MRDEADRVRAIQGLLAKAERTTFEEERESLLAKAAELVVKYQIDDAMLRVVEGKIEEPISRIYKVEGEYARGSADLAHAVARGIGCRSYESRMTNESKRWDVVVVGFPDDINWFEMLYTSLLVQSQRALGTYRARWAWDGRGRSERAARGSALRSYVRGFAHGVDLQLEGAKAKTEAVAGSQALVPLKAEQSRLDELMNALNLTKRKARDQIDAAGWRNGRSAGLVADVGRDRLAGAGAKAVGR